MVKRSEPDEKRFLRIRLCASGGALDAWRQAASYAAYLLGHGHDSTIYCQASLGKALVEVGSYYEAVQLLSAVLAQTETDNLRCHNSVELMHQCLARAHQGLGDDQKGYEHWLRAAQISQEKRQLVHGTTVYCYHQAARALARMLRFDEALKLFKLVYQIDRELFGDHIHTAYASRDLAICLNHKRRFKRSLFFWREASALMQQFLQTDDCVRRKVERSHLWTLNKVRQERYAERQARLSTLGSAAA